MTIIFYQYKALKNFCKKATWASAIRKTKERKMRSEIQVVVKIFTNGKEIRTELGLLK